MRTATVLTPALVLPLETSRAARVPIPALTTMRFVAAAAIFVFHSAESFDFASCASLVNAPCRSASLSQAVSFFFVLSGFILSYNYPDLRAGDRARFLWARFARLWPAHVAAMLIYLAAMRPSRDPLAILASLALVQSWIPISRWYFSGNPVSWSISTEFGFYLAFIPLIIGWRRAWWRNLIVALALAAGMVALAAVMHLPNEFTGPGVTTLGLVYFSPLARLFEFVCGMTAAHALTWAQSRYRPTVPVATAVEIVVLVATGVLFVDSPARAVFALDTPLGMPATFWLMFGGLMAVPFAVLTLVLALQRGAMSRRLLTFAPLVVLGEMSYSVYLTHQTAIRYYDAHHRAFDAVAPKGVSYAVTWAVVLSVSYLLWRFVERPMRHWLLSLPFPWQRAVPRVTARTHSRPHTSIAAAAVLVLLLPLVGYAQFSFSGLPRVSTVEVQRAATASVPEGRGVIYADAAGKPVLILEGAEIERTDADVRVRLTWRAMADTDLSRNVALMLVDSGSNAVVNGGYPQFERPITVMAGTMWQDTSTLLADRTTQGRAVAVGVGLFRPDPPAWLVADHGPRYGNGILLLLPLEGH